MIDVFLVDDEQNALNSLTGALQSFCPDVHICGTATTLEDARAGITETRPQLVLLDIEMGTNNGFHLLEMFDHIPFHVAFVTAHHEYAVQAFRVSAIDYILKPASVSELQALVQKVRSTPSPVQQSLQIQHMLGNNLTPNREKHTLNVSLAGGLESIKIKHILCLLAGRSYCEINLKNGNSITASKPLSYFDIILKDYGFYRIHHSSLINLRGIKCLSRKAGGGVTMEDGRELRIANSRREGLLMALGLN